MSSRDDILRAIRHHLPQSFPLPDRSGPWIQYPDPIEQFGKVLGAIGAELFEVDSVEEIPALLGPAIAPDKTVVSCIPGLLQDRFDLTSIDDPHQLAHVDLAILPGQLAVAENGAIWVTDEHVPHRVLFFLCQHLALVTPRDRVVQNLHEAYELIDPAHPGFCGFIAGPSKTADIEQSLVKGAHGARTLKVFLVRDFPELS